MNEPSKQLVFRSRLDNARIVKLDIVECEHVTPYHALLTVRMRGGKVQTPTTRVRFPRRAFMHLNRKTGSVWFFRPQAPREDINILPSEHKIRVGIEGDFK